MLIDFLQRSICLIAFTKGEWMPYIISNFLSSTENSMKILIWLRDRKKAGLATLLSLLNTKWDLISSGRQLYVTWPPYMSHVFPPTCEREKKGGDQKSMSSIHAIKVYSKWIIGLQIYIYHPKNCILIDVFDHLNTSLYVIHQSTIYFHRWRSKKKMVLCIMNWKWMQPSAPLSSYQRGWQWILWNER